MRISYGHTMAIAFLALAGITQAYASEPVNPASNRFDGGLPAVDCTPAQSASPVVNNTTTVDHSRRTSNRSSSTNFSNTVNKTAAAALPASVTVSNSCAPSHVAGIDSATSAALAVAVLNLANKAEKEKETDSCGACGVLEKMAPVFETLLWVLLIVFLAWRFSNTIAQLMLNLGNRINSLHIKTAAGEITADLRPIPEEKVSAHADSEVVAQSEGSDAPGIPSASSLPEFSRSTRSRAEALKQYYEAEDFVIRALEQEFGVSILRNVQTRTSIEMDGFFVHQETPYVIEVKMARPAATGAVREALTSLVGRLKRDRRFDNARVIMALVYTEEWKQSSRQKIETALFAIEPTVQIRWFSLSDLQRRFLGSL